MDYSKAIDMRCSRRKYEPVALKEADVQALEDLIKEYNAISHLQIKLVVGNGEAFDGFKKSYGLFVGVKNYIVMAGKKDDIHRQEKEGYYGEKLVLEATKRGLATCWIGSSYDRKSCDVDIGEDEVMDLVIAVGYSKEKHSLKEKMMSGIMRRNSKPIEKIVACDFEKTPQWFKQGIKAVLKAPTARNLMPVVFNYKDDGTVLIQTTSEAERVMVDVGIVKLHFELASGGGRWEYGKEALFHKAEVPTHVLG